MRSILLLIPLTIAFGVEPLPPGEMVRLSGRTVHVQCTGAGDTTTVLVSGIPRFSFHFALVQSDLSSSARVCSYDKGGEAWTDPLPSFTADEMLLELGAVVQHVAGTKPVILVGHSFGGILARAYYAVQPERVVGLVLVDTPHPDMIRMPVNGASKRMYDLTDADMEAVAEAGRKRNMQPMPPHDGKIAPPFDRLPPQLQASHLWAMKKAMESSRAIDPLIILKVQSALARRIKDQRIDVPNVVITRAKSASELDPWVESQEKLAAAGPRGKLVRAVGSGHDIQLEQPQLIVAAVREILASQRPKTTTR